MLSFNVRAGGRFEFSPPYEVPVTDVIVNIPGATTQITTRFGESPYVQEYAIGAAKRLRGKGFCAAANGNSTNSRFVGSFADGKVKFMSYSTFADILASGGFDNLISAEATPFQSSNRGGLDNVILGLDFSPRIAGVTKSGKKLIVDGDDFDEGAKILVNGKRQKKTSNDAENPATRLTDKKAGKKTRAGDIVQVENTDGTRSNEFRFTGPQ